MEFIKITKERIDKLMVFGGIAKSREQANSMLMAGKVFVNHKRIDKAGQQILVDSEIFLLSSFYR